MDPPDADVPDADWRRLLALIADARRSRPGLLPAAESPPTADACARIAQEAAGLSHPLSRDVYAPLIVRMAAGPLTIAQVGQSLDGRIATESGHSHYINGEGALRHLHRLRALADAVVVGATTAVLDDPQLTTRRVSGPHPVRVVLDPGGRVPAGHRLFDAAAPTLLLRAAPPAEPPPAGAEVVPLAIEEGRFPPRAVLRALHARGLLCVLIEGGGATLSAFLHDRLVHRLHVMLAPLLIGPGRTAFHLPAVERLDAALRFAMAAHPLGGDVLLDCDLETGR